MQGSCFGHENPDMWFSDTSDQAGSGAPSASESNRRLSEALQALAICDTCPADAKAACLILGMKPENLDNGIWGGTLSGERLLAQDMGIRSYVRKTRIAFAKKVRQAQGVTL